MHLATLWRRAGRSGVLPINLSLEDLMFAAPSILTSLVRLPSATRTQNIDRAGLRRSVGAHVGAVALLGCVTGLAALLTPQLDRLDILLLYILAIVVVAIRCGRGPAMLSAVLAVAAFDLFHIPPYGSFIPQEARSALSLAVMLVVGLVISGLTARVRMQADAAHLRERRTAALYSLTRELTNLGHVASIAVCGARHACELVGGRAVILLRDDEGSLTAVPGTHVELLAGPGELAAAFAALRPADGQSAHTSTLYLPLSTADRVLGVLGVAPGQDADVDLQARQLLATFCSQTALAMQRVLLVEEAQAAELRARTEELRSSLLSAVSHDVRTPLAAITAAASTLISQEATLSRESRGDLMQTIHEEAARMDRLVTNLLDMTHLDSGAVVLNFEWTPLEEPIGTALAHLKTLLRGREVRVHIAPGVPLVLIDPLLIEQLLVNLVENAIKYGGEGPLEIDVGADNHEVSLSVADRGPGIPAGSEARVFEKFQRAARPGAPGGVGLGLAICRAIAVAHGAHIEFRNRDGGGAVLRVAFPRGAGEPSLLIDPPQATEEAQQ